LILSSFGSFPMICKFYTRNEAHKQYSLLDAVFTVLFFLLPPGTYLWTSQGNQLSLGRRSKVLFLKYPHEQKNKNRRLGEVSPIGKSFRSFRAYVRAWGGMLGGNEIKMFFSRFPFSFYAPGGFPVSRVRYVTEAPSPSPNPPIQF
jgi:hypothetical protein